MSQLSDVKPLAGRRAFVTGSNGDIGAEVARRLAANGAAIILRGRKLEKLNKVAEELRASGAEVATVLGALGKPDEAHAVAKLCRSGPSTFSETMRAERPLAADLANGSRPHPKNGSRRTTTT